MAQMAHEEDLLRKSHQLSPSLTHHSCQREVGVCVWKGKHHKKLSVNEPQTGLTWSQKVHAFIWNWALSPKNFPTQLFWQAKPTFAICLGCSPFLKSIQEVCFHPPRAAFNPPPSHPHPIIRRRATETSHSHLQSQQHSWQPKHIHLCGGVSRPRSTHAKKRINSRWGRSGGEKEVDGKGSDKGSLPSEWLPQWLALHYHLSRIVLCAPPCLRWPVTR